MYKMCNRCHAIVGITEQCKCIKKQDKNRYKSSDKARDSKAVRFYNSMEWKATRLRIIERDNSLCIVCMHEDNIVHANTVHHIVELKEDNSRRCDKDNLISVCNSCHKKIHDEYKKDIISKKEMQKKLFKILEMANSEG